MTARKARLYLVNLGEEAHLVRAATKGQAVQTITKGQIRVRPAEVEDLVRIATRAGANITVSDYVPREAVMA